MSKQAIRQRLLTQRQQFAASRCAHYSDLVQDAVLASKLYAESESLALYASIHNEVRTERLLAAALLDGKRVCFPRVDGEQIVFVEVSGAQDLKPGRFRVPEPQGTTVVLPESLDLVFVPGIAFDAHGHRLGYGFGFYDRTLSACKNAEFIGLGYAFQVVARLPEEKHDIRLDYLATERELLEFKHKR